VSDITQILEAVQRGDGYAASELLPAVYDELRSLAAQKMAREKPGHTLQPTALVHEAYLRLVGAGDSHQWAGRTHFLAAAAEAMRRILVESARRKKRLKHGGKLERVDLDQIEIPQPMPEDQLLALDEALERLAALNARAAQMVKYCFFIGMTHEQAARELGISVATAERIWAFARTWLFREISLERRPDEKT
jgi:RNA polymerase sigma factor (TIGR02999 family)